jgi:hypothetical protein
MYRSKPILCLIGLVALFLVPACSAFEVGIYAPTVTPSQATPEPPTAAHSSVDGVAQQLPTQQLNKPAHAASGLTFSTSEGLWLIDAQGAVRLLVNQPCARLSADGTQVVYQAEDPSTFMNDIWLLDLATGNSSNLTNTPNRDEVDPMWWPDRPGSILFGSDVGTGMANAEFPTTVDLDGSGYQVLDEGKGGPWAISPDGQMVAYGGYGSRGTIYYWNAGPEEFDPAQYNVPAEKLYQPAWSPDGRFLAWQIAGDLDDNGAFALGLAIFDMEAGTAILTHIYEPIGGSFPSYLEWSPDGAWLAYVTFQEEPATGREPNLWIVRPDGSDEIYVDVGQAPVWSPDGQRLAYLRKPSDGSVQLHLAETGTWSTSTVTDLPLPEGDILSLMDWIQP